MALARKKPSRIAFQVADETRSMLNELTKIHDRSMTGVIEQLIKKDFAERGLSDQRSAS